MDRDQKLEHINHILDMIKMYVPCKLELSDLAQDKYMDDAIAWLNEILNNELEEVFKIHSLLPQEVWDRYTLFDTDDFREIKLLNEALKNLRVAIRTNRPKYFRKKYYVKKSKARSKESTESCA